ncbi:MAG: DUF2164 domain-containing protein [Pseudomonadota bacterium]|nr:DUF2164 family protein [Polaromonas sp.]MDQ3272914.1 DUF2164 domain-containing protein [Pseudomonadota bacterium]
MLDWYCAEIGALYYNQAIADAQKTLAQRLELVEGEWWTLEK